MESSDYHGSENNRSFIGLCPVASVSIDHAVAVFCLPTAHVRNIPLPKNTMGKCVTRFQPLSRGREYSDYCGLYGYTSFNAVRYFENIAVKTVAKPPTMHPDILYILYKYLIVFNDFKMKCCYWKCSLPMRRANWTRCRKPFTTATTPPMTSKSCWRNHFFTDRWEHKANIRRGIAHCPREMFSK